MSFRDTEKFIKQARANVTPEADKRMLDPVMAKFASGLAAKSRRVLSVGWGLRTAIAAAIIVVAGLFVYKHTGSFDGANPAYGINELVRATSNARWVRMTGRFRPMMGSPASRLRQEMVDFREVWYCSDPCMLVIKFGSGNIQVCKPGQTITYSAKENTIKVHNKAMQNFKLYEIRDMLGSMLENVRQRGSKIRYEQTTYENLPAVRVSITRLSEQGFSDTRVLAEQQSKRIRETSSILYTRNSKLIHFEHKFTYPATGPKDVFEAGAPRDAKIVADTSF